MRTTGNKRKRSRPSTKNSTDAVASAIAQQLAKIRGTESCADAPTPGTKQGNVIDTKPQAATARARKQTPIRIRVRHRRLDGYFRRRDRPRKRSNAEERQEEKAQEDEETLLTIRAPQLVEYRDVKLGRGDELVSLGQRILVDYEARLVSTGACFDRSRGAPLRFVVGHEEVVEGFEDGVIGMRLGGERTIIVPPALAYGEEGLPAKGVPPLSALEFKITLVGFEA